MSELANLVTADEATLIRQFAMNGADAVGHSHRIFLPPPESDPLDFDTITYVEASGRAHCRECGELIAKGEQAILFGFDARADGSPASWSDHLVRAFIHAEPCVR